jgi:hypothetical protein
MEQDDNFQFNLLASQRYYYLVSFKFEKGRFSLSDFWTTTKSMKKGSPISTFQQMDFVIEYSRIRTRTRFHNTDEDFSAKGDGKPPYQYDAFAMEHKKENLFIFCFPFKSLAKEIVQLLISDYTLFSKGAFQKAKLKKLLKQIDSGNFSSKYLAPSFSNLDLIYAAETDISAVQLDGDNPLNSSLFKDVFEQKINNDECRLEKCSLKCRTIVHDESTPRAFSNVHFDSFGNYKLYLHSKGRNIFTIPLLFDLLLKHKCLEDHLANPIMRLKDEQIQ